MMNNSILGHAKPGLQIRRALVALALFAAGSGIALANGEVSFATGKTQILSSGNEVRALAKGGRVVPGDTIVTGADGEVHMIMDDNAVFAVRSNSRMKIESYVAEGTPKDVSIVTLARGQLRSISGWIGKIAPRNVEVRTSTATIGIRGTDHEVAVIENGDDAGTYDKVNFGETLLKNRNGEVAITVGKAAYAPKTGNKAPAVLPAIPALYRPAENEKAIDATAEKAAADLDARLKKKQDDVRRGGGLNERGNQRIVNDCGTDSAAYNSFQEFIRAYESGNVALIRAKLDPAMVGLSNLTEGIAQDTNRLKQLRVSLQDTQLQCGPDVTVIQSRWEKRFLDVTNFKPGIFSGRTTILMHRDRDGWKLAAVAGDNPFASQVGVQAQLTFGPVLDLTNIGRTPTVVPVTIEVIDPDLAGSRSVEVQVATNQGDRENFALPEVSPGRFMRLTLPVSSNTTTPGNGVIEVASGVILTARYLDQNPGSNRPSTVLTRTTASRGVPIDGATGPVSPQAFSFAAPAVQPPSTQTDSNVVTIRGFTGPASVSIANGLVSINGGPFGGAPTSILAGQTVAVRTTSSPTPGGVITAILNIGGVTAPFSVITASAIPPNNTTPNPFSFLSPAPQLPNAVVTSNTVTITGINAPANVIVIGGSYSINGGAFNTGPGTITNNQTVAVRTNASPTPGGVTSVTLTVGGLSGTFNVTTAGSATPNPFTFNSPPPQPPSTVVTSNTVTITGNTLPAPVSITGGSYSIDGGAFTTNPGVINSNQTVAVRATSSTTPNGIVTVSLTVGGVTGTYTVATLGTTTPNPFSFTSPPPQVPSTLVTSNAVVIGGISLPVAVTVTGGSYSVNGSSFTTAPGTISNGQTLVLQLISSGTPGGVASATATVGGVSGTFTVTTQTSTPNPFSFNPAPLAAPSVIVTSNAVTITGNGAPAPITIVGGTYSINGAGFTNAPGSITAGQNVAVRLTSSGAPGGSASTTLTVGGVSATFTVTTVSTAPNSFSFAPKVAQQPRTAVNSTPVAITGMSAPASISITGGNYSINGGPFTAATGTITSGQQVTVQVQASGLENTTTSATVTIGGVSGTFSVTTWNTTPTPFAFTNAIVAVTRGICGTATSNAITVSGTNAPSSISIIGPSPVAAYSINGGAFTAAPGTIAPGSTVQVRADGQLSAVAPTFFPRATLTIGGVSASFNIRCP